MLWKQLHFNLLFLLVDDDIKPLRINNSSLNYINKGVIIPGIYKIWIYKQYIAKFNTYNFINVKLFLE